MGKLFSNLDRALQLEALLVKARDEYEGEEREKLKAELVPKYKEAVMSTAELYPKKTMRIFLRTFEEELA